WFDSDDLMHPEKLYIKIGYSLSENADIIVDTHTTQSNTILSKNPKVEVFQSADFYIDYILGKKPVITNDVMVHSEIIGEHRFDENLHKAQEYEFFTRLFEQKLKYCFFDLPLTFYREGLDSISKNTSKGNSLQVESLIYLSKLMRERHIKNPELVARAERLSRKIYKSLAKKKKIGFILKHFKFFRISHKKNSIMFLLFLIYNILTSKGFDRIKPDKSLL